MSKQAFVGVQQGHDGADHTQVPAATTARRDPAQQRHGPRSPAHQQAPPQAHHDQQGQGKQRKQPRPPLGSLFHEGRYGTPFRGSEETVAQLQAQKMIQEPAPLPWRKEEVRAVSRMLGLPEE